MLYIIRTDDVIGSRRGDERRGGGCEITALCSQAEPCARRDCREQGPGSSPTEGLGAWAWRGAGGIEVDNPNAVRNCHTGTK